MTQKNSGRRNEAATSSAAAPPKALVLTEQEREAAQRTLRAADTAERQRLADLLDNAATTLRSLARSAFTSASDARQTASDALLSFRRQLGTLH